MASPLLFVSVPAHAYTECTVSLIDVYAGDEGGVWLHYSNGGSSFLGAADPDRQATLSIGMTALTAGRQIRVRYTADGAGCSDVGRSDLIGIFLL